MSLTDKKESRRWSIFTIAFDYILATLVGVVACIAIWGKTGPFLALFIGDAVATVFIWIKGLVFRNVSVYDPYWSVAPPIIITAWALVCGKLTLAATLLLIAIWFWAIRLTYNWAYTFKNLNSEDWRYSKYRTQLHPVFFQLVNFFGLNMMPTVVVFLAMIPGLDLVTRADSANAVTWIGFIVSISAAVIQMTADRQAHAFRKDHKGQVCDVGLWKHGRHPNYFGEIAMWWGVWIMYVSIAGLSENLWYIIGPASITCLFCFISVPLMEGRQIKNKPGYAEYRKRTRMFI